MTLAYDTPTVPYVCDHCQYDGFGFLHFPRRCGVWVIVDELENRTIVGQHGEPMPQSSKEEFLESWLFFGLLSDVLGELEIHVNAMDFIGGVGCQQFITMLAFPRYLDEFSKRGMLYDFQQLSQKLRRALQSLAEAADVVAKFDMNDVLQPTILVDLFLCVQVLGESLELTIRNLWSQRIDEQFPVESSVWKYKQIVPFLRVNRKLWCRSELGMMHSNFDTTTLHFASTLVRDTITLDHSTCNYNHCLARQLDEMNYCRRHVVEGCSCRDLESDIQSIVATLNQGAIPCIRISNCDDQLESSQISVVASESFVAISHVWADGMGNPFKNSVYSCQVLRLMRLVDQLSKNEQLPIAESNTCIWIDTLCVPVDPKFQKYRKATISSSRTHIQ